MNQASLSPISPKRGMHFRGTVGGFGFRLGYARTESGRRVAPVSRENLIVLIGKS
jgi:hypothetical protein